MPVTNSHLMPLSVSSLSTMAVCSIGAHLGILCNPTSGTELSELSDDQRVLTSLRAKIDATVLCDVHCTPHTVHHYVRVQPEDLLRSVVATHREERQAVTWPESNNSSVLAKQYSNIDLIPGQKLCTQCRKHLPSWRTPVVSDDEPCDDNEWASDDDDFQMSSSAAVQELNTSLAALGESPIVKKRLTARNYANEKIKK